MDIKPIKTPAAHRAALEEIDSLMKAELGTPEGDRLEVLATLVEAYEAAMAPKQHWSIPIIDAGDRSGDGMLVLPDDLCVLMGWAEGAVLTVSVSDAGALTCSIRPGPAGAGIDMSQVAE